MPRVCSGPLCRVDQDESCHVGEVHLESLTEVDKPVLGLKWVGEGNEEETVDTEDRLFNNKKNHLKR